MVETLIFAAIAAICYTVIYTQIRALMAVNNPYSRRLLYAADGARRSRSPATLA